MGKPKKIIIHQNAAITKDLVLTVSGFSGAGMRAALSLEPIVVLARGEESEDARSSLLSVMVGSFFLGASKSRRILY